jgi:hypothetical protein
MASTTIGRPAGIHKLIASPGRPGAPWRLQWSRQHPPSRATAPRRVAPHDHARHLTFLVLRSPRRPIPSGASSQASANRLRQVGSRRARWTWEPSSELSAWSRLGRAWVTPCLGGQGPPHRSHRLCLLTEMCPQSYGQAAAPILDRAMFAAFTNLDYLPAHIFAASIGRGVEIADQQRVRIHARSKCRACRRQKDKEGDHETVCLRIGCDFARRDGNCFGEFLLSALHPDRGARTATSAAR